jgi:hypothetical protein
MESVETALETLRDRDHPIFSSHGPMAVEALEDLGHADLAPAWAEAYSAEQGLRRMPDQPPLPCAQWRQYLGDSTKRSAWVALIDRELTRTPWREVARTWLPRLLPAAACDAAHGMIRTAHALRSLRRSDSPTRRHELAEALGYWASAYEELPGSPGGGRARLASGAIADVPSVPLSEQSFEGSITTRLRDLEHLPGFASSVAALEPGEDLAGFADDLARTAALLYLANAPRARVIDFIHALDAVYAVRELLGLLDEDASREALFYGWQTVAALHASAGGPVEPSRVSPPASADVPRLVERAIRVGGAHALKFAQACLREYEQQPDPVFHAALEDMVERMEELRQKLGTTI